MHPLKITSSIEQVDEYGNIITTIELENGSTWCISSLGEEWDENTEWTAEQLIEQGWELLV